MHDDEIQDVIQVGLGPVGLTMAALVGQSGHTITAVERHASLYGLPRAGHIDHEIVRILQSLDCEGPTLADAVAPTEYVWVNAEGELLLEFPWGTNGISGYPSDFMQYQPVLEDALAGRAREDLNVTLLQGWEAVELRDRGDHGELVIRRTIAQPGGRPLVTDEERVLRGRYLIGADGAGSSVRRWLGIERDDLGFNERWLDVDVRKKRELDFDFDCGQVCDPARPYCVLPLGKRHRRWEWSLLPGELGVGPDDVEIVRRLVYTFEARTATRFRQGRTFLIGDAAHTMPPFMGQGMCSGMRDAKNLAWKLDLVLRGLAPEAILDSYEEEMRPYVLDWTVISLEAGKVPCITDPDEARRRDELFRSGYRLPMPDFPQVRDGILDRDGNGAPIAPAGELGLQAPVRVDDSTELFDRAFDAGGRWQIVSTAGDPRSVLRLDQVAFLTSLGTVFAHVSPGVDVTGAYAAYFAERGIEVTVARPDFYVFGARATLAELPELVDDLARRLSAGVPAEAAA